jgi:ABC-type nickel/cobalt efflux system permease component RcnA
MPLLGQAEAVVIEKLAVELAKAQPKTNEQYAIYIFVVAILIIGCGAFYVLRYMLTHSREIHDTSHKTITGLSEAFSAECKALREQHHRDTIAHRDMVHDACGLAQQAVSAKELSESLGRQLSTRREQMG